MDIFEKCLDFTIARQAMAGDYYPYFIPFEHNDGPTSYYEGREVVMCGSNNYLGLTTDGRVLEAARAALRDHGSSCTGSRLLNGNLRLHEELEQELADFFHKPAALVFSTGYHANIGTIGALLSADDVVLIDRKAHASIIDGCRLSGATVKTFPHNDALYLRDRLGGCRPDAGRLVVVDGVYSMEGDLCALRDIQQVCEQSGARLVVDDAHGAGVLADGRGTCEHFGLTDRVDLITVTFSKALASLGGAVLGSEQVIHYLRHHARSEIFSASITPANAAAALAALRVVRSEPWRARRALENAGHMRRELGRLGLDVGAGESPIVPVLTDDPLSTVRLWRRLMDLGVYTNAVIPPAASPRLRTSYMATHTPAQLEQVVSAFATVCDQGDVRITEPAVAG